MRLKGNHLYRRNWVFWSPGSGKLQLALPGVIELASPLFFHLFCFPPDPGCSPPPVGGWVGPKVSASPLSPWCRFASELFSPEARDSVFLPSPVFPV